MEVPCGCPPFDPPRSGFEERNLVFAPFVPVTRRMTMTWSSDEVLPKRDEEKRVVPYVYQDPELVLEHEGSKVYHAYDDEGRQRFYWYSTDVNETPRFNFDIRDTYKKILESGIRGWVSISKLSVHNEKHHPKMLKFAIRHEMLVFPEGS